MTTRTNNVDVSLKWKQPDRMLLAKALSHFLYRPAALVATSNLAMREVLSFRSETY